MDSGVPYRKKNDGSNSTLIFARWAFSGHKDRGTETHVHQRAPGRVAPFIIVVGLRKQRIFDGRGEIVITFGFLLSFLVEAQRPYLFQSSYSPKTPFPGYRRLPGDSLAWKILYRCAMAFMETQNGVKELPVRVTGADVFVDGKVGMFSIVF